MSQIKVNLDKLAELIKNNPLSYEVMLYDKSKGRRKVMKSKTSKKKYTLNQLGETVDKLGSRVDQLGNTVDKLSKKVDQIGDAVMQLTEITKNVVVRLDNIENRLNYIVAANKLKDLPKHS